MDDIINKNSPTLNIYFKFREFQNYIQSQMKLRLVLVCQSIVCFRYNTHYVSSGASLDKPDNDETHTTQKVQPATRAYFQLLRRESAFGRIFMLFLLILGHFWCSVVTSVTFISNLRNFGINPKIQKKSDKLIKSKKS